MSTFAAKTLVLVTGANGGIGFEIVAQLLSKASNHIFLCSRSVSKGTTAVQDLQSRNLPGTVELLELDVTQDSTIHAAADYVEQKYGKLDWLVNNAAVATFPEETPMREQLRQAFDVNATGPAIIVSAFGPLLKKGTSSPRIMNVSSGAGSFARRLDPTSPMYKMQGIQYRATKAAMNMITICQWVEYKEFGVKVFAYDPGFTVSNLSGHNRTENGAREVGESVRPLIDVLEGKRDDEDGKFLHNTGVYEW